MTETVISQNSDLSSWITP